MGGSHAQWAQGFQDSSSHEVALVSLPTGPWRWRLRAGAWPLAQQIRAHVHKHGSPDVLLVSGLVDVAQLLGFARNSLGFSTRVVVYQHESQLVYPTASGNVDDEAVLRNWSSWLVADSVVFNSNFHRSAVESALEGFLQRQPDDDQRGALPSVLAKFDVVPVGIDVLPAASLSRSSSPGGAVIVWPHRWEPDKNPDVFVRALAKLDQNDLDFGLVLAGEDGLVPSDARRLIIDRWSDRIIGVGPFPREQYLTHLNTADVVVSCAHHEFFGVAVAEAVAAGCLPVIPRALAYPELIEPMWQHVALYTPGQFGTRLVDVLRSPHAYRNAATGLAASMSRFNWNVVAPQLDAVLEGN